MGKCPDGYLCFNKEIFLLIAIAIICLAIYGFKNNSDDIIVRNSTSGNNGNNQIIGPYNTTSETYNPVANQASSIKLQQLENRINSQNDRLEQINSETQRQSMLFGNSSTNTNNYVHNKELEKIRDPLYGPERQYPYVMSKTSVPVNVPTRGYVSEYQQVGAIYGLGKTNNKTRVLPLYGKPTYPGSNKWLYYTGTDDYHTVKIPISKEGRKCQGDFGCDELYSGDLVNAAPYNCKFKVELYDIDKPRYLPNVFL